MDEKEVQGILTQILFCVVREEESSPDVAQKVTDDTVSSIYRLAKKHDLAHIVSRFIYQNKIEIGGEIKARLQREELAAVYRHEQMKYCFEEICAALEEANVPYVPLKGAVLRPYYPYEEMRTSCDIDVLIREGDLTAAIECLERKGYCCGERNYHDVSLYSQSKIHLELHFSILENREALDAVLKDAWDYTVPVNGVERAFSKEFFAFHLYAHMAYHFVSGGCGIRSLLDIWVMEHKMGISYACAKELLEQAGIYQFAAEMSALAQRCFSERMGDGVSDPVLRYIFQGGVYGSVDNHVAVRRVKAKSMVGYVLERLFLPYSSMVISYPILKKLPLLLPFCWILRWFGAVFQGKTKKAASELSSVCAISDDTMDEMKQICSRLGLSDV